MTQRVLLACLLSALAAPALAAAPAAAPAAAGSEAAVPKVLQLPRPKGGEWMGIYVLGKKAGWAFAELKEGTFEGRKAIVSTSRVVLQASVGGAPMERDVSEERVYEYKDGGRLLALKQEKRGDGGNEVLTGRATREGVTLKRVRPGQPDDLKKLPPTGETVERAEAVRLVAFSRKPLTTTALDLERTLSDKKETTEFIGESTITAAGVSVTVFKTRTIEEETKLPIVTTIATDGRELELDFGGVMVGKAESEDVAKQLEKVDIFNLTRVPLSKALPPEVREPPAKIVWKVQGLDADRVVRTGRQVFEAGPDGTGLLTITSRAPTASARRPIAPGNDKELKDALKATLTVDWESPAITRLAKEIASTEKDAWTVARRSNLFVHKLLDKAYGASSDRATDVLANKRGDCTEHALLLTAILRAAGIPARRADGLVYMQAADGVPALYWHEWVQAWVGEWIELDPTFNQPIADPTHVLLGTEAQVDTAGLIGKLKLEVAEIEAREPKAAPKE